MAKLFYVTCYRPQTKFVKVMFLHLSVSHSVHKGGVPGQVHPLGRYTPQAGTPLDGYHPPGRYPHGQVPPPGRYTPQQVHPPAGTPPSRYTPLGRSIPLGRYPSGQVHPPGQVPPPGTVHAGTYGQQVGSMHPTGMHSCSQYCDPFCRSQCCS